MARGSIAKNLIGNAILQVFPGAFIDEDRKTIRIPSNAEETPIEIKITLTAAKDVLGGDVAVTAAQMTPSPQNREMTEQEINEIRELITRLGL